MRWFAVLSSLGMMVACGGDSSAPISAGGSGGALGGATNAQGGAGAATGGVSSGGSPARGGAPANGGSPARGGASTTGGVDTTSSGGANTDSGAGGEPEAGADTSGGTANGGRTAGGTTGAGGTNTGGSTSTAPQIEGCQILPSDHLFNTPIDSLPVHPNSAAFISTIGTRNIHLDLGTETDQSSNEYYGIPYNVVRGDSLTWSELRFHSEDPDLDWDPTQESDCARGANHEFVSPCTATAAPKPLFPLPATPLVEGGLVTDPEQPYGDHHILLLDADSCRLWELYHCYPTASGWDIFGAASFDLRSNELRPAGWTSADAAGFPILPLLLRADEASAGSIRHALRFTIPTNKIRTSYTWPARHLTNNGTASTDLPQMGQLFRIKASYTIPSNFNTQSRAILQALKTYGMYVADGGSAMYVQGEPSASWAEATFSQVQSVSSTAFEAVDLTPITERSGFDPDSAKVP